MILNRAHMYRDTAFPHPMRPEVHYAEQNVRS